MALRAGTSMETIITDDRAIPAAEIMPDVSTLYPRYRLASKIGDGGYGVVYEIVDCDYRRFALKVQKVTRKDLKKGLKLKKEFDTYNMLVPNAQSQFQTPGIPAVYEYKEHEGLEYMIMERLGDSLHKIAEKSPRRKLSQPDVLMIGIQAVRRLRYLHENGILHRDVKPENLAMGRGENSERTVHFIDFGLATVVQDWSTYDYGEDVGFAGTVYYASAEALFHRAPTRKGDLEGLAYTLLSLAYGELPWVYNDPETGRKYRDSELGLERLRYTPAALCQGFPELQSFFEAVMNTKRKEEPDYERLINLLETAVDKYESGNDGRFDWLEPETEEQTSSLIYSGNQQQADEPNQQTVGATIENAANADPLYPPGFSFMVSKREDADGRIQIKLRPQYNCHAQKPTETVEKQCMPPSRPNKSSKLTQGSGICTTAPRIHCDNDGTPGSVRDPKSSKVQTSTLDLAEKPESQEITVAPETASENTDAGGNLASPQRQSQSDLTYMLFFSLVLLCFLDYRNQRNTSTDSAKLPQSAEDNLSELTTRKSVKEMKEEIVNEVIKEIECKRLIREESKMKEARSACDTAVPNASGGRRGRKRAIVKKLVSKAISRTVRAIRGPGA